VIKQRLAAKVGWDTCHDEMFEASFSLVLCVFTARAIPSYHVFQPIFPELKSKKNIRDTTSRAKFGCGTTEKGSVKKANVGLLFGFLDYIGRTTTRPTTTTTIARVVSAQQ